MGRFWSLLFLLVPILGVAAFVWAPGAGYWLPRRHLGARPPDRPLVDVHPGADRAGVRRHRGACCSGSCGGTTAPRTRDPVKFTHGSHNLEVVWTILPAATLLFIAIYQMNAWADVKIRNPGDRAAVTVEVTGRQFEWRLRYPGKDGKLGTPDDIYHVNDLHVPVNEEILVVTEEPWTCCTTSSCRTCASSRTRCRAWRSRSGSRRRRRARSTWSAPSCAAGGITR